MNKEYLPLLFTTNYKITGDIVWQKNKGYRAFVKLWLIFPPESVRPWYQLGQTLIKITVTIIQSIDN